VSAYIDSVEEANLEVAPIAQYDLDEPIAVEDLYELSREDQGESNTTDELSPEFENSEIEHVHVTGMENKDADEIFTLDEREDNAVSIDRDPSYIEDEVVVKVFSPDQTPQYFVRVSLSEGEITQLSEIDLEK